MLCLVVDQGQPFGMITARGTAMIEDGLKKLGKVTHKFDSVLPRIRVDQVKSDPHDVAQSPVS